MDDLERIWLQLSHELMADPQFDLSAFLATRPDRADDLRALVNRLCSTRASGPEGATTGAPPSEIPRLLREKFGVHGIDLPSASDGIRRPTPSAESSNSMRPGEIVGSRYRVLRHLTSGGMGEVFEAIDVVLRRIVALKILRKNLADPSNPATFRALLQRFYREACITAQLEHPSIVPVHDLVMLGDGRLVLAMKLIDGTALDAAIRRLAEDPIGDHSELTVRRRVEILRQAAQGVRFAHDRSVLHRDLKPGNIMIGRHREVHVLDWGLAKVLGEAEGDGILCDTVLESDATSPIVSSPGHSLGTAAYMSPEQARGDLDQLSERTDVFGLGAVLYQLITGQPPYWGASEKEVIELARHRRMNDPRAEQAPLRPPPELLAIALKAMAKDDKHRYANVQELDADLEAFLALQRGRAWSDPPWRRALKLVRRRPVATTVCVSLLALVVLLVRVIQQDRTMSVNQRAEEYRELARTLDDLPAFEATLTAFSSLPTALAYTLPAGDASVQDRAIDSYLKIFADHGLPIDGSQPLESTLGELEELQRRDPQTASSILDAMYHLAGLLYEPTYYAWAAEWRAGRQTRLPTAVTEDAIRRAAQSPQRLSVWSFLREFLLVAERDAHCKAAFQAFGEYLSGRGDAIRHLLEAEARDWKDTRSKAVLVDLFSAVHGPEDAMPYWTDLAKGERGLYQAHAYLCFGGTWGVVEWQEALEHGLAASALAPEAPWVRIALAIGYVRTGRCAEAIAEADTAANLAPTESGIHTNLGWTLLACVEKGGDPSLLERAESVLRTAITLKPPSPMAWSNLAQVLRRRGRVDEGAQILREGIEAVPNERLLWATLGAFLRDLDRWEEQIDVLTDAVVAHPDWKDVRAELASALYVHHRREQAIPLLEDLVTGEQPKALNDSGPSLDEMLLRARTNLPLALGLANPPDLALVRDMARAAYERAEYARSAELYERLLRELEGQGDPSTWWSRAEIDAWVAYPFAAQAAMHAARGDGYVHVSGAILTWDERLKTADTVEGFEAVTRMRADERSKLTSDARWTQQSADRFRILGREWLPKGVEALIADSVQQPPVLGPQDRANLARRILTDDALRELIAGTGALFGAKDLELLRSWVEDAAKTIK